MASCDLRGELTHRNGSTKEFVVKVDSTLESILSGVQKLNSDVSAVLTELVLQEKTTTAGRDNVATDFPADDEEEDSDDDADDGKSANGSVVPPFKRTKTLKA